MATKKKTNSNVVDVAKGWATDFYAAQFIAEKNYQLACQRDPSIMQQDVKFHIQPINTAKYQGFLAKYYYVVVNTTPVVTNHPQLKASA